MLSYKNFCYGMGFSNSFVIWDEKSLLGIIVDCGNRTEQISSFTKRLGIKIKWVVLTHAHYDHVLYMDEYREVFPEAKIAIGKKDAPLLCEVEGNVSYLFADSRTFDKADVMLIEGDKLTLGNSELVVISTPGHTPGCICLYSEADKLMVTGDTLFGGGGIGRTDFKYGSISEIRASLKRLLSMDGEITILPGHGGASKIAYEQRSLFY